MAKNVNITESLNRNEDSWGGLKEKNLFWKMRQCVVIPFQELDVVGLAESGVEVKLLSFCKLNYLYLCL